MFQMIGLIGSVIGAAGQMAAGQAAQETAELNAFNRETEDRLSKVEALQVARARRDEYDLATSSNIAAFAAAGRDVSTDKSVQAFLERQRDIIAQDVSRIDQQQQFESIKASMAAMAERRRGRNALTASMFSAVGTVTEGVAQFGRTRGGG
jgi:hypothetical protein